MAYYKGDTDHHFGGDPEGRVSIAAHDRDGGGLTITGNESLMYDETDWTFEVAAEHVDAVRAAVGAGPDESVADVFIQRIHDGVVPNLPWRIGSWLTEHGVEYVGTEDRWKS